METDELSLPRVTPRVLRQEVLEALRSAILDNRLRPGSRLLEADVATRMGVSRAPVREAIRQLEQEGLVEFFPHRGAVVVGIPEDEISSIYDLRSLIEERAIARTALRATPADLERLEVVLAEMRTALAARDTGQLAELDLAFHGTVMELSGFTLLRHMWSSLDGLVRLRSYRSLEQPGRSAAYFLADAVASHGALLDAIRAGDADGAAAAVREHIQGAPGQRPLPEDPAADAPGSMPAVAGSGAPPAARRAHRRTSAARDDYA